MIVVKVFGLYHSKGRTTHCFGVQGRWEWQKCLGKRKNKLIILSESSFQIAEMAIDSYNES